MSIKAQAVAVLHFSFLGNNGVGTVSIPGLEVGDVFQLFDSSWNQTPVGSSGYGFFEPDSTTSGRVVTVADQLYQAATYDLSAVTYHLLVYRLMP